MEVSNIERFHITATAGSKLSIPTFGGSMIRGVIGHALKQKYCSCGGDKEQHQVDCIYASLFETDIGHTFIISPPAEQTVLAGQSFQFHVTLLKTSDTYKEAFFNSLEMGFMRGLGSGNTMCQLTAISPVIAEFTPLHQKAKLSLASPWLLKYRNHPLRARDLTLANILISIARRQRTLQREGLLDAAIPADEELLQLAETLDCNMDIKDVVGERWSNRQQGKHPLRGITGVIEITTQVENGLKALTAMLHRAQWLHTGGKVSFGLGGLELSL